MTSSIFTNLPLNDARPLVDRLLSAAVGQNASDLHVEPTESGYELRLRLDGLLTPVAAVPADVGRSVVTRLMVLAKLLTYRLDVPQEGRASVNVDGRELDLRISIMPTVQGLRAAVRLPTDLAGPRTLDGLGFSKGVTESLKRFARAESGLFIVTGPAGSGKTTTLYALLAHIAGANPGTSIVSLEDPVERVIPGVTQIEVKPFGELTYEKALRSILRQDPQVLMLGEIRDIPTAQLALQAAMTGHRLLTTLHASSSTRALSRLLEMGLEPYQLTNSLHAVLAQRLLRRLASEPDEGCASGHQPDRCAEARPASAPVSTSHYQGRLAVGELLHLDEPLRHALLARADAPTLDRIARAQPGYTALRESASQLVGRNLTDTAELARVFGDAPPSETTP